MRDERGWALNGSTKGNRKDLVKPTGWPDQLDGTITEASVKGDSGGFGLRTRKMDLPLTVTGKASGEAGLREGEASSAWGRWSLRFPSTSKWRGQIGSGLFKNEKLGVPAKMDVQVDTLHLLTQPKEGQQI